MRKLLNALTFTGFSALGMIASTAQAGVILFQDSFDSDAAQSTLNFDKFVNWDVSNGTVDYIRSPNQWGIACVTGCVDIDGSNLDGGRITTKNVFNLLAEHTYKLSVDISGNQRANTIENLTLGLSGASVAKAINPGNVFSTYSVMFSGMSLASSIFFETSSNDNIGAVIDNVAFECVTCGLNEISSVPEPGVLGLFALGLTALGFGRKRKSAQVA